MLPTIILRHKYENLKKCSLSGLEKREDMRFYPYPKAVLPDLSSYIVLSLDAPILTKEDAGYGLFLIDGTWNYAKPMFTSLKPPFLVRSLPAHYETAYPRRQTGCEDPKRGLASIEALFLAYHLTERDTQGLLDHYYWKNLFFQKNQL